MAALGTFSAPVGVMMHTLTSLPMLILLTGMFVLQK
jgi:hypothetical protein